MPRFYVKNKEDKWNVYSTVIDNLLFDEWVEFKDLTKIICQATLKQKQEELQSLLTDRPVLNVMSYEECMEHINN